MHTMGMIDVLKFQTLVACQKDLDNRADPDQTSSRIRVFAVCYSDKNLLYPALISAFLLRRERVEYSKF